MLDIAIGDHDPSQDLVAEVEAWTTPLTSGWDQLDATIEWHLKNVSLLLQRLAASERIYVYSDSPSEMGGGHNRNLLCIREDLIAMAIQAQVSPMVHSHYVQILPIDFSRAHTQVVYLLNNV